jgi:methylenetetrahydrofolate dehydrogenase (NADP+)/methenyltetrahydrofolate cyclohydrolase
MKILNGSELTDFIKQRQSQQVRALRQAWQIAPKLAIIQTGDKEVSTVYIRMKAAYADDIEIDIDEYHVAQSEVKALITDLNKDSSVHGIIVQLPLTDPSETDQVVNMIAPEKDVDGLGENAEYISATATAVDWLFAGYNVQLKDRNIVIVGNGRLVGKPLAALWATAGHNVTVLDDATEDITAEIRKGEIVVTATGVPGLITEHMIQPAAVIVDAGTATEGGKLVGDVAESVRERQDITITPMKGGVGPLTVAALFDNVITAAKKVAERLDQTA